MNHFEILLKAESWHLQDDVFVATWARNNGYDVVDEFFTEIQLSECHPEFPGILRRMISKGVMSDFRGNTCIEGVEAFNALEFIKLGHIELVDSYGYPCFITNLTDIEPCADNKTLVKFTGSWFELEGKNDVHYEINVIKKLGVYTQDIDKKYLDEKYLGWEKRWLIAKALEIDAGLLLDYVFTNPPKYSASINDITFLG